jgi:hypothetical protein
MDNMSRDIREYAADAIAEALEYAECGTDIDQADDAIYEALTSAADSYALSHNNLDTIQHLERDHWQDAEEYSNEKQYTASEYSQAMEAYAENLARAAIMKEGYAVRKEIEEAADELMDAVAEFTDGTHAPDASELKFNRLCPHGWASHDKEENGLCFWVSRQLDGCNSIAANIPGGWISYTWTPTDSVQA